MRLYIARFRGFVACRTGTNSLRAGASVNCSLVLKANRAYMGAVELCVRPA